MGRLGISIYPGHSTMKRDFEYMELAATYGFKRLFTCFLSVVDHIDSEVEKYQKYIQKAHELGYTVSLDTNPAVFEALGASYMDIKIFADMGVDILRLDISFGTFMDAILTRNPYDIKIELNGSFDNGSINLLDNGAVPDNLFICHNFYPQKYTGLRYQKFIELSKKWKEANLLTSAFVSSRQQDTFGPWEVYCGLPTLEMHRGLPISLQARHLISTGLIDDIIIGNAYASEEELKELSQIRFDKKEVKIKLHHELNAVENKIVYALPHFSRLDESDYLIRSYLTKKYAKKIQVPAIEYPYKQFKRGAIVMINDNLEKYRGELQIVLQAIGNEGYQNIIGEIKEEELIILENIKPGSAFAFIS